MKQPHQKKSKNSVRARYVKTTSTFVPNEIDCVKIPMWSFSSHFFELRLFQLFDISQSLLSIIVEKVTPIQSASSLEEDS